MKFASYLAAHAGTMASKEAVVCGERRMTFGELHAARNRLAHSLRQLGTAVGESGIPGYAMPDLWIGFLGPRGLASAIVNRLNAEIAGAVHSPDVAPKLETMGYELGSGTAAQFSEEINRSLEIYAKITSGAGIKPQ